MQRKDVILHLGIDNYSEGPLNDRDRGGEDIWIFGKPVDDREIYIKLKLTAIDKTYSAICLSFHPAEYTMTYPFS